MRDVAQGAWRMRQLAKGQTIVYFVSPETKNLIAEDRRRFEEQLQTKGRLEQGFTPERFNPNQRDIIRWLLHRWERTPFTVCLWKYSQRDAFADVCDCAQASPGVEPPPCNVPFGARGWSDDDGCDGKMLLGVRGWSDDDGFGGKMLLGARGWSGGCDGTMGDSAVGVAARSGDEWLTFERSSDTPSHRLTIIVPLLCPPARSSLDSTLCSSSPPPSL